ncbi:MAG: acetoacetate--CoA ligase [Acidimicrobiia bacterium]
MTSVLWQPQPQRADASLLARFATAVGFGADDYEALWQWSVEEYGEFWQAVWDRCGVLATEPPSTPVGRESMPGAEWFPGARLNYAQNLLRGPSDEAALLVAGEDGSLETITRADLWGRVARVQAALRDLGVGVGDRVAGLVTNGAEAVVAMLATAASGAIWSSTSPDFGAMGVIDRFGQIEPTVLICVDGYQYNGTAYDVTDTVATAVSAIPSIRHTVVIDRIGRGAGAGQIAWDTLTSTPASDPEFAQLPFDHPLFIVYSSGTTGPPKSIVHGAGGTLLKHLCEHQLHSDLRPADRLFWFTTCGWMMWNWLVGGLGSGAAIVLYDGSPSHPDLGVLWRLAAYTGITHFGTSPRFLAANAKGGVRPRDIADLGSIRWIGSTGSPLNPNQFDWVYDNVSQDVHLASISGGTDIIGCFAIGVPTLPVRRGELQARALGMAVEAWDDEGRAVIGEKGELVCTKPFPSMPVAFWNDPDGSAYHDAYFAEHPGVWTHGDFIEIRPEGGVVIHGRSDTTLNPGGVRIGTAEIYRAIETMPEVVDSIVIGHDTDGDTEVVLFVVLADGEDLDDDLTARIKSTIRDQTSPRHVPRRVMSISEVPYTISGKKVEKAVRLAVAGKAITNRDALANPSSLDQFVGILD